MLILHDRYSLSIAEAAPVQKVKVLPITTSATKLRATDNGIALHQIGTISHRKINDISPSLPTSTVIDQVDAGTRSPTPDYSEPRVSRGRKKTKTQPSFKSDVTDINDDNDQTGGVDHRAHSAESRHKYGRNKLRLFKNKSELKSKNDADGRIHTRSMVR